MSIIWGLLVVVFGFGALYSTLYLWGLLYVSRTDELNILHKYQKFYIWGPLASKKLEAIYEKQLDECTTAEKAMEIRNLVQHLSSDLYDRACQKWEKLALEEMTRELESARGNEGKLLALLEKVAYHPLQLVREIEEQVMDALRPFTEKRIREATTVRELVELKGVKNADMFSFGEEIGPIDNTLIVPYANKLRRLVLEESINASSVAHTERLCFSTKTGDYSVDILVSIKRDLLRDPCLRDLLPDVNFRLRLFLDSPV